LFKLPREYEVFWEVWQATFSTKLQGPFRRVLARILSPLLFDFQSLIIAIDFGRLEGG
jgi:hypothetical protein